MSGTTLLLSLLVYLVWTLPWCALFVRAGKRWWVALLPVVNALVVLRIARRPWWWFFLLLVPLLGIAVWTIVCLDVAERFGHGVPFAVGLVFAPFVFATWLAVKRPTQVEAGSEPVAEGDSEPVAEASDDATAESQTMGAGE